MARWWNRMPQFDGLFDYQNHVRPAYFSFKLLSRLAGQRLGLTSDHPAIHGLAAHDDSLRMRTLLLWNFSSATVPVELTLTGIAKDTRARHLTLDAAGAHEDENARLRPEPFFKVAKGEHHMKVSFEPYALHYWSFEEN
jgi:hypothetical protein